MSEIETKIQIHEKIEGVQLASIWGGENPVAIVEDKVLDKLYVQCERAKKQALENKDKCEIDSILTLCNTLSEILVMYSNSRNSYYEGVGPDREVEELNIQIEDLVNELDKFHNPV